jgi:hypothetical protein
MNNQSPSVRIRVSKINNHQLLRNGDRKLKTRLKICLLTNYIHLLIKISHIKLLEEAIFIFFVDNQRIVKFLCEIYVA